MMHSFKMRYVDHSRMTKTTIYFGAKKKVRRQHAQRNLTLVGVATLCLGIYAFAYLRSSREELRRMQSFYRRAKSTVEKFSVNVSEIHSYSPLQAKRETLSTTTLRPAAGSFIQSISEPLVHGKVGHAIGAWMKDSALTSSDVYIFEDYFKNSIIKVYDNATSDRVKETHKLPYFWGGTGHVIWNGNLYYNSKDFGGTVCMVFVFGHLVCELMLGRFDGTGNCTTSGFGATRYNTSIIVQYDLRKRALVNEIDLPGAGFANACPYQWAGSTDIDFAVDRSGLWVIYGTESEECNIIFSKLHSRTLKILGTWKTYYNKKSAGNTFVIDGVLYALQRYDKRHTKLNYAYDSKTESLIRPGVPITIRHEFLCMLDYNHKERRLYGWDKGYLVTYDVTLR